MINIPLGESDSSIRKLVAVRILICVEPHSFFYFTKSLLLNMISSFKALSLLGFLATSSFAAAVGLNRRQATPSNFKLYAYAAGYDDDTIGGFPVFYADGMSL
jgi:hypothetical protein